MPCRAAEGTAEAGALDAHSSIGAAAAAAIVATARPAEGTPPAVAMSAEVATAAADVRAVALLAAAAVFAAVELEKFSIRRAPAAARRE